MAARVRTRFLPSGTPGWTRPTHLPALRATFFRKGRREKTFDFRP